MNLQALRRGIGAGACRNSGLHRIATCFVKDFALRRNQLAIGAVETGDQLGDNSVSIAEGLAKGDRRIAPACTGTAILRSRPAREIKPRSPRFVFDSRLCETLWQNVVARHPGF